MKYNIIFKRFLCFSLCFIILLSIIGCNESISLNDENTEQITESIPSHNHVLQFVEGVSPSCTEDGNIAYYICTECNKLYTDETATNEIVDPTLKMTGHDLQRITKNNIGHLYDLQCSCGYKTVTQTLSTINISTLNGEEIEGSRLGDNNYYECNISIDGEIDEYDLSDVSGSVKVRGNYTADYDKKPYRIKFDKKQCMLGLNNDAKAKSWVLLAEYKDYSLMRNSVAFYLGSQILGTDGYYVSDYIFVEVYVNETYRGVYLLCEQQQVNEYRVNINEPEEDYAGTDIGYFVEMDEYAESEKPLEQFKIDYPMTSLKYLDGTDSSTTFENKYAIKSDIYSQEQNDFIKLRIQRTFEIIYDSVYADHSDLSQNPYKTLTSNNEIVDDPSIVSAKEAIEKIVDLRSLVDTYILNEICLDIDIGWSSFLMSVDMSANGNQKLTFQAPWDWDSALGYDISETNILLGANHYSGSSLSGTPKSHTNPWLLVLVGQDWFWEEIYEKWSEIKESGAFEEVILRIDLCYETYESYFLRNNEKWGSNYTGGGSAFEAANTPQKATEYLKNFLIQRTSWLDEEFTRLGNNND